MNQETKDAINRLYENTRIWIENEILKKENEILKKENAGLKKQLNKKTAPPEFSICYVWNTEKRPKNPLIAYSGGALATFGGELITYDNENEDGEDWYTGKTYRFWEEIEIKVK